MCTFGEVGIPFLQLSFRPFQVEVDQVIVQELSLIKTSQIIVLDDGLIPTSFRKDKSPVSKVSNEERVSTTRNTHSSQTLAGSLSLGTVVFAAAVLAERLGAGRASN